MFFFDDPCEWFKSLSNPGYTTLKAIVLRTVYEMAVKYYKR